MNITAIAERNRRQRMEQIQRLLPVKREARAAADELYKAKSTVGLARSGVELMSKLKHMPGFFPTPPAIVEKMIDLAGDVAGKTVLEPSAGKGNIADILRDNNANLMCVEFNYQLVEHLRQKKHECIHSDFLEVSGIPGHAPHGFQFVIMNPPFERKQDIAHVKHAHSLLCHGGRLVSIVSSTSGTALEDWASDHGGYVEPLPAGSFSTSERPTGVNCSIVVASK